MINTVKNQSSYEQFFTKMRKSFRLPQLGLPFLFEDIKMMIYIFRDTLSRDLQRAIVVVKYKTILVVGGRTGVVDINCEAPSAVENAVATVTCRPRSSVLAVYSRVPSLLHKVSSHL